ncbi:hypothetical protein [Saccharothrix coeruleofusca]|uniref:DUF3558 domain-containing protein n=1 Tax=Saccharothrix coeruleofusca TaxID=33919 RepID=A0A918AHZ9_9PSEU|nr:hypothetical protein [Saccharothrix coeruleofusca]MBP2334496.1 hypothetical protein [Saccharothrix coeruleofusca]GGP40623.1 hypothetical protein GCM10010185_09610 [Saccharothrix coeruleofusca]
MQLRRVSTLAAVTAVLALGLGACAQQVAGNPVAARESAVDEPSPTGSSAKAPTRTSARPTGDSAEQRPTTSAKGSPTGSGQPTGVKITQRKKTTGFEDCDILSPEEVASTIGARQAGQKGCVQITEDPFVVVLLMVTVANHNDAARPFELGGNTAYEIDEQGDCTVMVMLTDDPKAITPALIATVTPVEGADTCDIARKLVTKAFEKIPNA